MCVAPKMSYWRAVCAVTNDLTWGQLFSRLARDSLKSLFWTAVVLIVGQAAHHRPLDWLVWAVAVYFWLRELWGVRGHLFMLLEKFAVTLNKHYRKGEFHASPAD